MDILSQKTCSKCGNLCPTTSFYRDNRAKDGLQSACKKCQLKDKKAYALQHREELKLYKLNYRADHPDYQKNYYAEHREEISQQRRGYYQANQEHLRQYSTQFRKTERGILSMRTYNHARKARKRANGGKHTTEELYQQLQRQKNTCYYCHKKLGKSWHADHILPLSRGGSNSIDNIVIACPDCNQSKYNKLLHEWKDGGRLL